MRLVLLLCCAALAGCSAMSEQECRTSSWYALGERDALLGQRPQIERYAEQCGRYAVKPAENDYLAGWGIGYSEWNRRVSGSRM
jgi:Protein of unknown function (DUF2799)